MPRQRRFRAPQVEELVRLVRGLVERGAAELGEPDRLAPRHPGGRRGGAVAGGVALVMGVLPPAAQVLLAPDPRLVMGAVGDRRAELRGPVGVVGIVPVVELAALDPGAQIARVVGPPPVGVEMGLAVAPVGQRQVVVDADEVDLGRRPERVEVKAPLEAARPVAGIFGPVGSIAELHPGPEDPSHVPRERDQRRDRRVAAALAADLRQPHHFRADDEGIDPARERAEMGVMQDEAAIAPVLRRAVVADLPAAAGEMLRRRGAEEGRDLRRRHGGAVRAAGLAGGARAGDAAAPRQHRLVRRPGPGIAPAIAGELVHQHEGIEDRLHPPRRQRPDRFHHRGIGRRPAIDRAPVHPRHLQRRRSRDPARAPGHAARVAVVLDLGADGAVAAAQVVAEPRHHQRHRPDPRKLDRQRLQRRREVALVRGGVAVDHPRLAEAEIDPERRRGEGVFAGAGDQRHRLDRLREAGAARHRPRHLEGQQRHPVAPALEVQPLDHHIGDAAEGRRLLAQMRGEAGVGQLRLVARIDPHAEIGRVDLLAIGPDPADAADGALAEREGGAQPVADLGHLRPRGRALAAAPAGLAAHLLERRGPDHMAGHPHLPPDAGDRRALAGGLQPQPVDPPGLDRLGALSQHPLVDHPPEAGADRAADHRGGEAEDRAAEARPDRCAHG